MAPPSVVRTSSIVSTSSADHTSVCDLHALGIGYVVRVRREFDFLREGILVVWIEEYRPISPAVCMS